MCSLAREVSQLSDDPCGAPRDVLRGARACLRSCDYLASVYLHFFLTCENANSHYSCLSGDALLNAIRAPSFGGYRAGCARCALQNGGGLSCEQNCGVSAHHGVALVSILRGVH